MELVEHGAIAAIVHEPVREETVRRLGGLDGLGQAAGWVYADDWLDELRAELERQIARADPLDPGVAPPSAPWSTAIVPLLGLERRGAKLYRPGATAELGARGEAAAALEAQLGLEPVKVEDAALARYLEEQGRLIRVGDGSRSRAPPTRRREMRSCRSARAQEALRSPASATCSASGGGRRSCCSSASMPTDSRAAWATSVCCADVGQSRHEPERGHRADRALQRRMESPGPGRDRCAPPSRHRLPQPHRGRARRGRRRRTRAHRPHLRATTPTCASPRAASGRRGLRRVRMDADARRRTAADSSGTGSTSSRSETA